ncbi:CinA family protein [Nocardia veterana]|uniref:CinA family protein n=1 Tax=Nocardia veterana TaxID=132249 RepID=A0A7X6M179_9NOCA|nr:CinA family protein [Nocardia veterana]
MPPDRTGAAATADPLSSAPEAVDLVGMLTRRGQTVATAESLTAGLLAATLAGVPGASLVLRGGLVVYATDLKHRLAGVSEDTLAADGPVAAGTAEQLAVGARTTCAADWGIGLTGVAGPDPQGECPVGTVFLGLSGPGGTEVMRLHLAGDRWTIRMSAVRTAIIELLRRVDDGERTATG